MSCTWSVQTSGVDKTPKIQLLQSNSSWHYITKLQITLQFGLKQNILPSLKKNIANYKYWWANNYRPSSTENVFQYSILYFQRKKCQMWWHRFLNVRICCFHLIYMIVNCMSLVWTAGQWFQKLNLWKKLWNCDLFSYFWYSVSKQSID